MDFDEKIKYLKNYKILAYKLEFMETKLYNAKGISYGVIPGGSSNKTLLDRILSKDKVLEKMQEIAEAIASLNKANERAILEYRYLLDMSLDDASALLGLSERQGCRLHREAVEHLAIK